MKKSNIYITIAIVGVLLFAGVFLVRNNSIADWGNYNGYHMGTHMMGFGSMGIMMLFFWGLIIAVFIMLIRWVLVLGNNQFGDSEKKPDALELLKKRFAKGEIDQVEYMSMKQTLQK
jgi:putative membrane protein